MIREVDLVSYLPPFMQTYKEPVAALEAENPEFQTFWKAVEKVQYNRFISTADEYAISRYEKMMGIYPAPGESLESRRSAVQARWMNNKVYTLKALIDYLNTNCGEENYKAFLDENAYTLTIIINDSVSNFMNVLMQYCDKTLPMNMVQCFGVIFETEKPIGVNAVSTTYFSFHSMADGLSDYAIGGLDGCVIADNAGNLLVTSKGAKLGGGDHWKLVTDTGDELHGIENLDNLLYERNM